MRSGDRFTLTRMPSAIRTVHLARLQAIVERLALTKDGKRVIPEMDTIYHPDHPLVLFHALAHFEGDEPMAYDYAAFVEVGGDDDIMVPVSECYSTWEAAEAAREAKP